MTYSTKIVFFIAAVIVFVTGGRYLYYQYVKQKDKYDRPWAYNNAQGYSLTGSWQGKCTGPDGQTYNVLLDLVAAMNNEKIKKRILRKRISRDRSDKTLFKGIAEINNGGHTKKYEIGGGLNKADSDSLHFQFKPVNDQYDPGFHLNLARGIWQGNKMDLTIEFSFYTQEGVSQYNSANPLHNIKGRLLMKKIKEYAYKNL